MRFTNARQPRANAPLPTVLEMDESWDAEFDGELRVPDSVRSVSENVRSETHAARCLAQVVTRIRAELMKRTRLSPTDTNLKAVALVHASIESDDDAFYTSQAWQACKNRKLEVSGNSIESVLLQARLVEDELQSHSG